ncbi:hypothetical protein B0H10DRAFT_1943786 [Mycena sp. CBHHK59/15]|nr:hypothetical protein B0H10DRAFT_1943786 [Mycena sp. CBHHK59/15]
MLGLVSDYSTSGTENLPLGMPAKRDRLAVSSKKALHRIWSSWHHMCLQIVNPLLPTTVPMALFQIINPLLSTPLSPLPSSAPTTSGEEVPLPAVIAPVVTAPVAIALATNIPVIIAAETKKETKAAPGPSITVRNLCMIDWCKDHPGGYLSVFKLHWDVIEKSAEKLEPPSTLDKRHMELVQIGTCHAGTSYKRSMGTHSKVHKTRAANLLQNLSNTTKHAWDELSPKKLWKWLSPRKRHKENATDNTEIERSVTGDASDDPFHTSDTSNDPFHVTDASMQSFHVPGFTESASVAPAAREFVWKLPKQTVEEVDDEDDWQSTNTFPPPAQPCPLLASLAENCTDDPRDLIDVPEADDELLVTSPAHDDDYPRPCAPHSFLGRVHEQAMRPGTHREAPNLGEARAALECTGYKDPNISAFMRNRLIGIQMMLNFYLTPGLEVETYARWGASARLAAHGLGRGAHCARVLAALAQQFILSCEVLDVNPYGEWNESILADEDLTNDIWLHLQSLGKEITAEKLVEYLNDPIVCAEHNIDKAVSLTMAH